MAEAQEIEITAVRLLTTREHSRKELLGKLRARGYAGEEAKAVLDGLARQGLQSDRRFTETYIESRVRRGNGPLRIRAELRERGIDEALVAEGLEVYAGEWWEALRQVHNSKYGAEPPADRREMARRARFLEYRGFPSDLIARFLFGND